MNRFASIDLGTNSFLLLVVQVGEEGFHTLYQESEIVRIGKKVDSEGRINDEAFEVSIEVLTRFADKAESLKISEMTAAGTSALRDAANAEIYVDRMRRETGIKIEILSGEDEARWTFLGATRFLFADLKALKTDAGVFVVDIGGGSTELIFGDEESIQWAKSLDVGAVRMTERCVKNDPASGSDEDRVRGEVRRMMATLTDQLNFQNTVFLGVGGTITTLAAMMQSLSTYDASRINGYAINRRELDKLIDLLKTKNSVQRKELPGLEPKRADVITAGAFILRELLSVMDRDSVIVTDYGLRYGLILRLMKRRGMKLTSTV